MIDYCTWEDCDKCAVFLQTSKDGRKWANLCSEHNALLQSAYKDGTVQAILSYWVRAQGGPKAAAAAFAPTRPTRGTIEGAIMRIEPRKLAGRCANGLEGGRGDLYHAMEIDEQGIGVGKGLCGAKPGRHSAGWQSEIGESVTCLRCLSRLKNAAARIHGGRACKDCPHIIGDIYERDCGFPDCLGYPQPEQS
jgi:hypothetical protein